MKERMGAASGARGPSVSGPVAGAAERLGLARVVDQDGTALVRKGERIAGHPSGGRLTTLGHEAAVARLVAAEVPEDGFRVCEAPVSASATEILFRELTGYVPAVELLRAAALAPDVLADGTGPPHELRAVFRHIGAALAQVHSIAVPEWLPPVTAEPVVTFPLTVEQFTMTPDTVIALLRTLDTKREAERLLTLVRSRPTAPASRRCLAHGDFKLDNIMIASRPGAAAETPDAVPDAREARDLRIIDWELAGVGVPEEDIGALAAATLAFLLPALLLRGGRTEHRSAAAGQVPAVAARWCWRLVAAAVTAYTERGPAPLELPLAVDRMAARLFGRVQATLLYGGAHDASCELLLRAALALAATPDRNVRELEREVEAAAGAPAPVAPNPEAGP